MGSFCGEVFGGEVVSDNGHVCDGGGFLSMGFGCRANSLRE